MVGHMKLVLALLAATTVAHADQQVTSRKSECAVTVPDSWKNGMAPDHKLAAVVSTLWGFDSFADAKVEAKKRFKGKVVKETDSELEIEGPSETDPKVPSVHRSIAGKYCAVVVTYDKAGSLDDARKIARTLTAK